MICTECGRPVMPIVAMDIDGTLGDYHRQLIEFAMNYTGIKIPEAEWYRGDMRMKHWAMGVFQIDERSWKDLKLAYRQGSMKRSMPVFDGAAELCGAIIDAGAELWLTTTRPYMRLDNVDPDTRHWLERQQIQYDGLLYDENKYEKLAELVDPDRVVAVVDDLPEQVMEARRVFNTDVPIHRRSQFNQSAGMKYEMADLSDIQDECVLRVATWKEEHQ